MSKMNKWFGLVVLALASFGCSGNEPSYVVDGGGQGEVGGQGGQGGMGVESTITCDPGGRYVCHCDNGNIGNKFCAWSGNEFSECTLCGPGSIPREPTTIYCNTNPKGNEVYTPCPHVNTCKPLTCWDNTCVYAPAIPSALLEDESPNDCTRLMCDGYGNAIDVPDPLDCDGVCNSLGECVK